MCSKRQYVHLTFSSPLLLSASVRDFARRSALFPSPWLPPRYFPVHVAVHVKFTHSQHYLWAFGHLVLLVGSLRYFLAWLTFKAVSTWWYKGIQDFATSTDSRWPKTRSQRASAVPWSAMLSFASGYPFLNSTVLIRCLHFIRRKSLGVCLGFFFWSRLIRTRDQISLTDSSTKQGLCPPRVAWWGIVFSPGFSIASNQIWVECSIFLARHLLVVVQEAHCECVCDLRSLIKNFSQSCYSHSPTVHDFFAVPCLDFCSYDYLTTIPPSRSAHG